MPEPEDYDKPAGMSSMRAALIVGAYMVGVAVLALFAARWYA